MILTAYHESARVVFAYLNGYACDLMEFSLKSSNSSTKLNAGSDIKMVQAVLSGNPLSLPNADLQEGVEVAKKLLAIYSAGTCAKIFYQNDLKIPAELELDISGQDLAMIEKIQTFLKKAIVDYPDDFPSQTMVAVFRKLRDADVWKAIDILAAKAIKEDGTLKRFYIEDTLMMAGMSIRKPTSKPASGVGLHEDDTVKAGPETKTSPFDATDITPLDVMLKDFLKKIKSDWKEDELNAAIAYLHNVYRKYGQ